MMNSKTLTVRAMSATLVGLLMAAGCISAPGGGQEDSGDSSVVGDAPSSGGSGADDALPLVGGSEGADGAAGLSGGDAAYPCDGSTSGYNAVVTRSGSSWVARNGSRNVYSGGDMRAAVQAALDSLRRG